RMAICRGRHCCASHRAAGRSMPGSRSRNRSPAVRRTPGPSRPARRAEASRRSRCPAAGGRGRAGAAPRDPDRRSARTRDPAKTECAEGRHLPSGELAKRAVQFLQRRVALCWRRRWTLRLTQHERLLQRLFSGGEVRSKRIAPAGTLRLFRGPGPSRAVLRSRRVQAPKHGTQRPFDEMNECLRIRERGSGGLGPEEIGPARADRGRALGEGLEKRGFHGNSRPDRTRAGCAPVGLRCARLGRRRRKRDLPAGSGLGRARLDPADRVPDQCGGVPQPELFL
ncbi:MAG: hypothetical protein RLZZ447_1006, partial [Verrucomicrobiota bacterium]